jgi:ketosteroid isomerase-like protein
MILQSCCAALSLAIMSAPTSAAPSLAVEKQTILALRAENNRAIAAHDLDGTMRIAGEDYVLTGGSSGIERSQAEARKGWAEEFATQAFERYVRTPTQVQIGERKGVLRAAELGRWEGFNRKAAGSSRPFGRYFVHWSKATGTWKIVSETYVTLGCRGPGC